jgi:limonene-1,2-epoxide hydrolase
MNTAVKNFCAFYKEFTKESISKLDEVYDEEAIFEDPIDTIEGCSSIQNYFGKMMANVTYCRFIIKDVVSNDEQAFVTWSMTFAHPRLNKHKEISVVGVSQLKFNERITYHRDYFDVGSMIYENVPALKQVVGIIKKRLAR